MSAGMRPAAQPFMTDGRAHPPSHTRAVDADPDSDAYVFDFGKGIV